jgi:hypothetical protein
MVGQWPNLLDAGNGTFFEDSLEVDEVVIFLMTV